MDSSLAVCQIYVCRTICFYSYNIYHPKANVTVEYIMVYIVAGIKIPVGKNSLLTMNSEFEKKLKFGNR